MSKSLYEEKNADYYRQVREDVVGMIDFPVETLLNVGCGTGATANAIKESRGAERAVGVELPGDAAVQAEKHLDELVADSVEALSADRFEAGEFDLVVCADVLEHLFDPWDTLRKIKGWLKPDGRLVVSLPHMGHLTVMLKLFFDRLEYEDEGILDRTHHAPEVLYSPHHQRAARKHRL